MKQRIFAILMTAVLLLGLLTACGNDGPLTPEDAQEVVLKHAGVTASQVSDIHTHVTTNEAGEACYSIHITIKGETFEYLIHGTTGEVLSVHEGGH